MTHLRGADIYNKALITLIGDDLINYFSDLCSVFQIDDTIMVEGYFHEALPISRAGHRVGCMGLLSALSNYGR